MIDKDDHQTFAAVAANVTYRVSITVKVIPSHADDIALLAWLLESENAYMDGIDLWADRIVDAFLYWRDAALDSLPDRDIERLYAGFSTEHLEARRRLNRGEEAAS